MLLLGASGFNRVAGHSERWRTRPYTAEERRAENERRSAEVFVSDATVLTTTCAPVFGPFCQV